MCQKLVNKYNVAGPRYTSYPTVPYWNALEALAALNKVCFELHKGPDGVSKTWEEVAIEVSTYLREE